VGFYSAGNLQTLIESWNGSVWSVVSSSDLPGDFDILYGVSCTSSTACVAVGDSSNQYGSQPLVEYWDGNAWSLERNLYSYNTDTTLFGVSCINPTSCIAVGDDSNNQGPTGTLVEAWDGAAWSVVPSPDPSGVNANLSLNGVSCTSSTSCFSAGAVGSAVLVDTGPIPAFPVISSPSATTFTTGSLGTFAVTVTGIPTPSIMETGTLPTGVSFVDNGNGTATLAGRPGSGTGRSYPMTITASNGVYNGLSSVATQNFTLVVHQAPAITSAATVTFVKGKPGTFTVKATGYPTTMTFTKIGTLPGGVGLTHAGVLSGTPTAIGTSTFTITASNGVLPNAKQIFTLKVVVIKITTLSLGTATKGTPYSHQLTELGGVAPFTWTNTTPKLPAGLTLSAAGKITGTVRATVAPRSYSVGISLHDSATPIHNTTTAALAITVK